MLSSVIDRLTSLVSKYFLIGAFIPVLIFSFLTGVVFYYEFAWFRAWAQPEMSGTAKAFNGASVLIFLSVAAYLLSTINTYLREVLEGKHLLPMVGPLLRSLEAHQQSKLSRLEAEYADARFQHGRISEMKKQWQSQLSAAAAVGKDKFNTAYAYPESIPDLTTIRNLRAKAKSPAAVDLEKAVNGLSKALETNNAFINSPDGKLYKLKQDRDELLLLLDYAEDSWASKELRAFNTRQASFGCSELAPTSMGNVALSMQGYAITRYQLNLDKFWGDLQIILQTNKEFYAQLQDTKVQLDFLVACCFLSFLFTITCMFALLFGGHSAFNFYSVAFGGPISSFFFYFLAVRNYAGFAELVRAGVDLYRFQLLDSLRIGLPRGISEERLIWETLHRLSLSGAEWIEISYQHPQRSGN